MANIKLGGTTAITESSGTVTLDNAVQDNITRLGTVTSGSIGANVTGDGVACVKITSGVLSSTASSIVVDGFFDDTKYHYYQLIFDKIRASGANFTHKIRINTAGSAHTGSDYYNGGGGDGAHGGGTWTDTRKDNWGSDYSYFDTTWTVVTTANANASGIVEIWHPQSTDTYKMLQTRSHGTYGETGSGKYVWTTQYIIMVTTNDVCTGITYYGGTFAVGSMWALYGFRK